MGLRLKSIEVAGFRGFNTSQSIPLNQNLVIFYAQNGFGKSSFCEAIEWALYGETARQMRGEKNVDKREFSNSLRNCFYPSEEEAFVTIQFYDPTTEKDISVKRTITDEDGPSNLSIDGVIVEDLSALRIPVDTKYSLILQHSIRDFIFSKPSERLRVISAQLGMRQLSNLQEFLQNASRSFKSKPPNVKEARSLVDNIKTKCVELGSLEQLLKLFKTSSISESDVIKTVNAIFTGTVPPQLTDDKQLIQDIDKESDRIKSSVFDCPKIAPIPELDKKQADILSKIEEMKDDIKTKQALITASVDKKTRQDLFNLTHLGLSLVTEEMVCPLCRQVITEAHIETMKKVLESKIEVFNLNDYLKTVVANIKIIKNQFAAFVPYSLTETDQSTLKSLSGDTTTILEIDYPAHMEKVIAINKIINRVLEHFEKFIMDIGKPENIDAVRRFPKYALACLEFLDKKSHEVTYDLKQVFSIYSAIETCIQGKLLSSVQVQRLALLRTCLEQSQNICLALRDIQVESESEEMLNFVQTFTKEKRTEILKEKSDEMAKWFALLHPNKAVTFKGMQPSTSKISLLGDLFGEEVDVSSTFSEAQLNCLGLSFYALAAFTPDNPLDFVIIDDPVQSMDQSHIDSFQDGYLRKFLDSGRQIILLTHMQTLSLSLDTLFNHLSPLTLEIESYDKSGPKIIESKDVLVRLLEDIRFYMKGDSEYRRTAGSKLRRLLERLIKDLYRKKNGALPKKYESASWTDLRNMVPVCGLDTAETGRLFQSYKFCVTFPHDDETKEPPSRAQIESHCDRLNRIKEKYLGT